MQTMILNILGGMILGALFMYMAFGHINLMPYWQSAGGQEFLTLGDCMELAMTCSHKVGLFIR